MKVIKYVLEWTALRRASVRETQHRNTENGKHLHSLSSCPVVDDHRNSMVKARSVNIRGRDMILPKTLAGGVTSARHRARRAGMASKSGTLSRGSFVCEDVFRFDKDRWTFSSEAHYLMEQRRGLSPGLATWSRLDDLAFFHVAATALFDPGFAASGGGSKIHRLTQFTSFLIMSVINGDSVPHGPTPYGGEPSHEEYAAEYVARLLLTCLRLEDAYHRGADAPYADYLAAVTREDHCQVTRSIVAAISYLCCEERSGCSILTRIIQLPRPTMTRFLDILGLGEATLNHQSRRFVKFATDFVRRHLDDMTELEAWHWCEFSEICFLFQEKRQRIARDSR